MTETGESFDIQSVNPPEAETQKPTLSDTDKAQAFVSLLSGLGTTKSGVTQFNPDNAIGTHSAEEIENNPALKEHYQQLGKLASETNERVMDSHGIPAQPAMNTSKKSFLQRIVGRFKG